MIETSLKSVIVLDINMGIDVCDATLNMIYLEFEKQLSSSSSDQRLMCIPAAYVDKTSNEIWSASQKSDREAALQSFLMTVYTSDPMC